MIPSNWNKETYQYFIKYLITIKDEEYKKFQNGKVIEKDNVFSINYNELNGRFDFDFYSPENRKLFSNLNNVKTVLLGDVCDIVKIKSIKLKNQNSTVEYVELSDINTHSYEIINSTTYRYDSSDGEIYNSSASDLREGDRVLINSYWWSPKLVVIFR